MTFVAGTRKVKKPTANLRFVSRTPPRLPVLRTSVYHIGFMVQRQNARGHPAPGDIRFDSVGFAHGKYLGKQVKP